MGKVIIHTHGKTADKTPCGCKNKAQDAALTDEQFKSKVSEINSLLTDASRKASQLANDAAAGGPAKKAQRLEALIDEARRYAFQIR